MTRLVNTPYRPVRRPSVITTVLCSLLAACSQTGAPAVTPAELDPLAAGQRILYEPVNRYEFPDAIPLLEKAVARDPEQAEAWVALAYAYQKVGRFDDARQTAHDSAEFIEGWTEPQIAWMSAIWTQAIDAPNATSAWRHVTELDPNNRWAWYELSAAALVREDFDAAVTAADAALKIAPDPRRWEGSWVYYLRSKALFRAGRPADAAAAAAAGKSNTTTWRATYFRQMLGVVAGVDAGREDEFVNEYRAISAAEGRNSTAYTELNLSLFFFELGDMPKAIEFARRGLALEDSVYGTWALGYALAENGEAAEALNIVDAALADKPANAQLLNAKAWALYRLGRFVEARDALTAARLASRRRSAHIEKLMGIVEATMASPDKAQIARLEWLG